jgi:hypothetical protein
MRSGMVTPGERLRASESIRNSAINLRTVVSNPLDGSIVIKYSVFNYEDHRTPTSTQSQHLSSPRGYRSLFSELRTRRTSQYTTGPSNRTHSQLCYAFKINRRPWIQTTSFCYRVYDRIRTDTGRHLRPLPLPVGIRRLGTDEWTCTTTCTRFECVLSALGVRRQVSCTQ